MGDAEFDDKLFAPILMVQRLEKVLPAWQVSFSQ